MKSLFVITSLFAAHLSWGKVTSEKIEYKDGATTLDGYIVYDTAKVKSCKKLPGAVVVHDWMGVGDYVKMRAEQMASLGYVAFVADIYGKGVRPKDAKEAGALAGQYKEGDRKTMRSRAEAAFKEIKKNKNVTFRKEMDDANVDYQFIAFGGAVHSFTEKHAGNDIKVGAAYNERADQRSFAAMKTFLAEVNP